MLRVLRISGHSLTPEYQPGDFVLISKIPWLFSRPHPGDVVAFHHSAFGLLIKQISAYDPRLHQVTVLGTHADSVDSREFGPVSLPQVLGKVLWHIHPRR